jgi:signal peptidase II
MNREESRATKIRIYMVVMIVMSVLFMDQWIKWMVKTHMYMHERIHVFDWFYLFFTENKGFAFGLSVSDTHFLALFRIVAVAVLGYYLYIVVKRRFPLGYVACISFVLAGALGNVIDNALYGMIYSESTPFSIATVVPWGEGYAGFLQGRVVDMFYFPLIETDWPDWMPFVGGDHFIFFSPIFNFADAAISCGGIALLLFYHRFLTDKQKESEHK